MKTLITLATLLATSPATAQHPGHDGGRCNANEQHVIESDPVIAVLQRQHALHFMRFDHRGQHIVHRQGFLAFRPRQPTQVVRGGEDAAQVV